MRALQAQAYVSIGFPQIYFPCSRSANASQVLLSFIITNFLSLSLSAIIILLGLRKSTSAPICRKLLLSFSDQQILTGIGIQSIGLAKMNTMVPYHFFIVWLLSLLSTATNLVTLLALVNDFKRDWVLRWLRQFLMFINLILGCITGIFVLQSVMKNLEPRLPIGCVWEVQDRGTPSNAALSVTGTIAVIAGNAIVFVLSTWYLHARKNPRWIKSVQVVGLVILVAMGIGATIRVIQVSQAFGSPPESVHLVGTGEKDWSFGQLLPLLLLSLPLISTVEIVRGEMRITPNAVDDETAPLMDTELQYTTSQFQPNPLWGSQTHLFRK
ncbi:hypothetical protein CC78DRAFT_531251 [Lojkania enalia]|uniref:Uncharacterized protein n=1 Tax=Lojkania enalia TaxID=147567 RepID=A0A9P4KDS0_9PLEO|nr:hypothetical protein CC78DRAFT_531251 [Didymosphaeria enalia]